MRTRPEGLPDAVLLGALSEGWDLRAVALEYCTVGFGSHHWCATEAGDRRWFVTGDDLEAQRNSAGESLETSFARLRMALTTARAVRDAGAAFVVAPIPSRDGAVVRRVSTRYALALYPYVEGESRSGEYEASPDRGAVLDLIVKLHASPAELTRDTSVDDFMVTARDALMRALRDLSGPWDQGPYSDRARVLLARHAGEITRLLDRYDQLAEEARGRPDRMVLTHGEPHIENVIFTTAGPMLIDWDTTMIAPPERDLWMVESGDGTVSATYTKATGRPVLPSMLELYRLRWELSEVAIYTALFRQPHTDDADTSESWKNLNHYVRVAPNES